MSFVNIKPATILCGHCRPLQEIGETLCILGLLSTRWSHPKAVDWWERLLLATLWIRVPIKCPAVKSSSNGVQFCEWGCREFEVTCVSYWMEGETIWTLVDVHRVVSAIKGYRFNCKPIKLSCSTSHIQMELHYCTHRTELQLRWTNLLRAWVTRWGLFFSSFLNLFCRQKIKIKIQVPMLTKRS